MGSLTASHTILKKGKYMIKLTRIDGSIVAVNEDFIENISQAPDTIIMLQNGRSYIVKEDIDEIIKLTVDYKKACFIKQNQEN